MIYPFLCFVKYAHIYISNDILLEIKSSHILCKLFHCIHISLISHIYNFQTEQSASMLTAVTCILPRKCFVVYVYSTCIWVNGFSRVSVSQSKCCSWGLLTGLTRNCDKKHWILRYRFYKCKNIEYWHKMSVINKTDICPKPLAFRNLYHYNPVYFY